MEVKRHLYYIYAILGGLCLWTMPLLAQSAVIAELDSASVETGNPCVIHLLSPKAEGSYFGLDLSAWDSIIPKDNVLNTKGPLLNEKRDAYEIQVNLIFFDADTIFLPPARLQYEDGNVRLSNPLTIVVNETPSPAELADMRDIADIHKEALQFKDFLPWVLSIGLVILLILALFFWYARKNRNQFVKHQKMEKPPRDLALSKLNALKQKQLWQKGNVKAYYAELTFIFREFLEGEHQIPALESTSEEWLVLLRKSGKFEESNLNFAEELMQNADLAKFAKGQPPESFHDLAWFSLHEWITKT